MDTRHAHDVHPYSTSPLRPLGLSYPPGTHQRCGFFATGTRSPSRCCPTWYRMPPSKLFEALHARDAKRVKHLVSKEGCDVNETGAVRSLTPSLPSR